MLNKIFQNLYFFGLKGWIKRKVGSGMSLHDYSSRMVWQWRLAKLFGGAKIVMIGDSNMEGFALFRFMRRWKSVAVNIGIGGTTADGWVDFLTQTDRGNWLRREILISGAKVLFNVGGNNVLQRSVGRLPANLKTLYSMFPSSWACLAPPIHLSFFASVIDPRILGDDIKKLNDAIRETWKSRTIDLYAPFINPVTGEAFAGILRDPIHFSDVTMAVIIEWESRILQ